MEFIYFGNDWFAENRTSSHHIAKRLGSRFPLLYVEVPGLRAPGANARDLLKIVKKLRLTFQPPQPVGAHFWRMTLPQIPLRRFAFVRAVNRRFSLSLMRRAIRKLGFNETIAWFHAPHPGFLAKQLDEKLTVFYCIDEYSKLPDIDGPAVQAMDDDLTRASDIVFVSSSGLLKSHERLNPNIHLSQHGVDTEVFNLATSPDTQIPEEVLAMRRPIIGFWGLLDRRVDFSLLEHIARERPAWTILLIGHVQANLAVLKSMPNVVFMGIKPYSELPKWAKAIDVGLMPYMQNSQIWQSCPLKLREYLAAGKPIVAVPLPGVQEFGKLVLTATDGPGFVRAIEEALATNNQAVVAQRQKAVEGSTWDAVVDNALKKLQAEMAGSSKRQ